MQYVARGRGQHMAYDSTRHFNASVSVSERCTRRVNWQQIWLPKIIRTS